MTLLLPTKLTVQAVFKVKCRYATS